MPRRLVQLLSLLIANFPFLSFLRACPYPFLHCHACPVAIGACPVGTLQHFVVMRQAPFYLVGVVTAVAALSGRATCAWLCPFGLVQEWLRELGQRLRLAEVRLSNSYGWLRWPVLAVLVLGLPALLREPWFCRLCPAGTLTAGIPMVLTDPALRSLAGSFFALKLTLLTALVLLSLISKRPFCRFLCPLGLVLGLGNRIAFVRLEVDPDQCTGCGSCSQRCPVNIDLPAAVGGGSCIQCGQCTSCAAVKPVRGWQRPAAARRGQSHPG